jgi:hypothetical protein
MKIFLPTKLIIAIDRLNLSITGKNKALHFINFLMQQYQYDNCDSYGFTRIPSKVIRDIYKWRYNQLFMSQLCKNKIIIRKPFHNSKQQGIDNENGRPFGYKINFEYLDFTSYKEVDFVGPRDIQRSKQNLQEVIDDMHKLEFDIQGMLNETSNFNIDSMVQLNDDIKDELVEVDLSKKDQSFTVILPMDKVKNKAKARIKKPDIIKLKGVVYLEQYHSFKKKKETSKKLANLHAISRLAGQDFYATRNLTNNRLDTNLTNLDKQFFMKSFVKLDGEPLVEIDLKNAQPTLLIYLMNTCHLPNHPLSDIISGYTFPDLDLNREDVSEFLKLSATGHLYERIQMIGTWDRDIAKKIFLKVMFSKEKHRGTYKKQLMEVFPTVIAWMDEFKKINTENKELTNGSLSSILQKTESAIFIDDIYFSLRKQGYQVFSKHDCILCKASEREIIKMRMEERIDRYGFFYTLS